MKIILNNEEITFQLENEKTIGEVLGSIEAYCRNQKNTITEVKANGQTLTASSLDNLFSKSVDEDIIVELSTTSGNDIRLLLQELGSTLIKNANAMEEIPLKIQTGNNAEVFSLIEDFSNTLAKLYGTSRLFDIADITEDYLFENKMLGEYQKEISELLSSMVNAIEENDSVEISDIAEYELSPLVKQLGNGLLSLSII